MQNNPLAKPSITARAADLWQQAGCPVGQRVNFLERARELIGIEDSPHAGELPNPETTQNAGVTRRAN
jgi:hypothetical protein